MIGFALKALIMAASFARWAATSDTEPPPPPEMERRLGGKGQPALYHDALRTGIVPAGANRIAWLRELRGENDEPTTYVRVLDVVIVVLVAGEIAHNVLTAESHDWILFAIVAAGLVVLFAAWKVVERFRRTDHFNAEQRLLTQLERQAVAYNVVSDLGSRRRRWLLQRLSGRGTGRP